MGSHLQGHSLLGVGLEDLLIVHHIVDPEPTESDIYLVGAQIESKIKQ